MARRNISPPDELDRRRRMADLGAWLDELDAVHGAPPAEAIAEAEAWLAAPSDRRRPADRDGSG